MGNRNAPADPGGPERLPPLEHPEQRVAGALVEPEQPDELGEDLILGSPAKVDRNGIGREEVGEVHGWR
jgi:hypothetical protein